MQLYFITGNEDKFREASQIIANLEQLNIDLPEIQHIDARMIIKAKLEEAYKHKQASFIVEDVSLYLDCLKGLPGPLIKWFLKTIGNTGLFELTEKLDNNRAEAKAIVGYARNEAEIEYFEGVIQGTIVSPRGEDGFGWDPIFVPDGHKKSFAEMSEEEKNKLSMRRLALEKLKNYLNT